MKVTGFSFIKNAVRFDYPIVEAIRSILPLCDEVVVAVGDSEDNTRETVSNIAPNVRVIDTVWDPTLRDGGRVLAAETDKAFKAITGNPDWCFYIQGDEVMHEQYIPAVKNAMLTWKDDARVDGLLFKYRHFYGSFDYVAASSKWYRHEIRIIRHNSNIFSYRDAQGFRKAPDEKLQVKEIDAYINHYGWVRPPKVMMDKTRHFGSYWHGDDYSAKNEKVYSSEFDYTNIDMLERYNDSHPAVMQERINRMNWQFSYDLSYNRMSLKERFKRTVEKITGNRPFEYRNYKILP